ncbi:uncharacterized protein BO66DRAFT_387873 [Aspergillus aculeatinus CBS 121060]|uniref:Uncharacterized protein n=1 Tax=Aspergillus aculeatinus CBS 121060 TaxID=1448322 RepID=A0ACD1HLD6_9EURO|nr:hypothetical protein BO66DRAFT_387873 [Aspergillus aculeatinus CBS 121060]RAH74418.1 hypothetical protein BO66DRAFT_387873 [Aspergillus aculeatinus CBS 121060]
MFLSPLISPLSRWLFLRRLGGLRCQRITTWPTPSLPPLRLSVTLTLPSPPSPVKNGDCQMLVHLHSAVNGRFGLVENARLGEMSRPAANPGLPPARQSSHKIMVMFDPASYNPALGRDSPVCQDRRRFGSMRFRERGVCLP